MNKTMKSSYLRAATAVAVATTTTLWSTSSSLLLVQGKMIITEIMPYPTKAYNQSRGEWFELYNNSTQPINLVDWTIRQNINNNNNNNNNNNDRRKNESFRIKTNLIVRPQEYIVFGTSNNTSINGGVVVNYVYNAKSLVLANSDQLMLVNRNGRRIDMVKWNTRNFPNSTAAGSSIALRSINYVSLNTVGARWCLSSTLYGQGDRGTPGTANDCPPFIVGGGGGPTVPTPPQRPPVMVKPPMIAPSPPTAPQRPMTRPIAFPPSFAIMIPPFTRFPPLRPSPPITAVAVAPRPVAATTPVMVPVTRPVAATPISVPAKPVVTSPITMSMARPPVASTPIGINRPVVATTPSTPTRPVVPSGGGRVSVAPSSEPSLVIGSGIIDTPTRSPIRSPIRRPINAPVRPPTRPPTRVPVRVPIKAPVRAPTPTATVPSNAPRAVQITSYINEITQTNRTIAVPPNSTDPLLYSAPEDLALQWLINDDPLQLVPNSTAANLRITQRYALTSAIYFQPYLPGTFNGYGYLNNWLSAEECTWNGVKCTLRNLGGTTGFQSVVASMDFDNYLLQGGISSEVALLSPYLEVLSFTNNLLVSTLPTSLGRLALLTYFSIQNNDLTGTIPSSVGQWSRLVQGYFDATDLTGSVPSALCALSSITTLQADCAEEVTCTCCTNCA